MSGGVGAQLAIAEIAHATSHCRFEASDAAVDELVLLRILAVMRELICEERAEPIPSLVKNGSESGATEKELESGEGSKPRPQALADCLGEESICEMMETGLSMCCQMRLSGEFGRVRAKRIGKSRILKSSTLAPTLTHNSLIISYFSFSPDLLRRTAEQNLTSMIRTLFSRLSSIPTTADETFNPDPNATAVEPEHATLAADPVGNDAETLTAADEKKLRRMTMPDPKSRAFPAAADVTSPSSGSSANPLDALKEMGEAEERAELEMEQEQNGVEGQKQEKNLIEAATGETEEDQTAAVETDPEVTDDKVEEEVEPVPQRESKVGSRL